MDLARKNLTAGIAAIAEARSIELEPAQQKGLDDQGASLKKMMDLSQEIQSKLLGADAIPMLSG